MKTARAWNLFICAYTFVCGLPLLLFPAAVPGLRYEPGDEVWVRVTGMCCLAYSYFNYTLFRQGNLPSLRANVFNQTLGLAVIGWLAFQLQMPLVDAIAVCVLVSFVGLGVAVMRVGDAPATPADSVPMTAKWNWYVAGYTFIYGVGTAIVPHLVLPLLGFTDPVVPWARISGLFFFILSVFNIVTALERGTRAIVLSIFTIRVWFVVNLLVLGLVGFPWFMFASACIVSVGVIGTIVTYRREMRARRLPSGLPT